MQLIPEELRKTIEWLIQIEEFSQARDLALTAARFLPADRPETTDFLAMILHRTKYYQEALEYAEKTVSFLPENLESRFNLARCLNSAGHPDLAEAQMKKVIAQKTADWMDPVLELALYICNQGRFDEAEKTLLEQKEKLPSNHPQHSILQFNLGWHFLRHGKMKDGMQALRVGRKVKVWGAHAQSFPKPQLFSGLPVKGKKILLVGEAGAGDEIINARYAKILQEQGASCIWATNHGFESLFSRVPGIEKVIPISKVPEVQFDYWAPTMDLFSILDLDRETLPKENYLSAHPEYVEKWKKKIPENGKLKVGLRWQGNPAYEQDLYRSVPFSLYRRFFDLDSIEFYSLQRDSGAEEISSSDPIQDLAPELKTWEDTAAAISLLDVVVTSCTSIAHLAGALGKKTFLLTPRVSYYIWTHPEEKSIWYPDVQLFRQKKYRDWSQEVDLVREALQSELKK